MVGGGVVVIIRAELVLSGVVLASVLTGIVGWRVVTIGLKVSINAAVVGIALVVVVTVSLVVVAGEGHFLTSQ